MENIDYNRHVIKEYADSYSFLVIGLINKNSFYSEFSMDSYLGVASKCATINNYWIM